MNQSFETETADALLIVALQDLHDAERAWGERIAVLRAAAGAEVKRFLDAEATRSAYQLGGLADLLVQRGAETEGAPNIWLRAILDDAERDATTIAPVHCATPRSLARSARASRPNA